MSILSIDFETRSAADLRKTGAARYFEDPSADVLCAAWCVDDGPVQTWVRGQPCPPEIEAHVAAGLPIAAWNATFEAWAWKYVLGPKHGWPVPALSQWVDTMAQAAAMSIPQSLDGAAQALAVVVVALRRQRLAGEPVAARAARLAAHVVEQTRDVDPGGGMLRVGRCADVDRHFGERFQVELNHAAQRIPHGAGRQLGLLEPVRRYHDRRRDRRSRRQQVQFVGCH